MTDERQDLINVIYQFMEPSQEAYSRLIFWLLSNISISKLRELAKELEKEY